MHSTSISGVAKLKTYVEIVCCCPAWIQTNRRSSIMYRCIYIWTTVFMAKALWPEWGRILLLTSGSARTYVLYHIQILHQSRAIPGDTCGIAGSSCSCCKTPSLTNPAKESECWPFRFLSADVVKQSYSRLTTQQDELQWLPVVGGFRRPGRSPPCENRFINVCFLCAKLAV